MILNYDEFIEFFTELFDKIFELLILLPNDGISISINSYDDSLIALLLYLNVEDILRGSFPPIGFSLLCFYSLRRDEMYDGRSTFCFYI